MTTARTFTPKEFSAALEAEFGVHLSARWVRARCAKYVKTRGKSGLAVVLSSRPYLIPATELLRFNRPLVFGRKCA